MSDDEYGPALPPGLRQKTSNVSGPELPPHLRKNSEDENNGPCLPATSTKGTIGPVLPPHLRSNSEDEIGPSLPASGSKDSIGPVLPPHLRKDLSQQNEGIIGPVMPPGLSSTGNESSEDESIGPKFPSHLKSRGDNSIYTVIGPSLPHQMNTTSNIGPSSPNFDDTDVIGPLPCEMLKGDDSGITAAEIESRARQMRDRLEGKDKKEEKISRESWMMELPSAKLSQNIGLQARSFRARAGPDLSDRSEWTDTPADRERKTKEAESCKKRSHVDAFQSEKDKQMLKDVKKYNKSNRPESLLEMHQKELKKKKKTSEEKPTERRPFDREVDLQVNRFDDAQRKAIIKKSQKLDSRFSHGGSQFL